VDRRTHHYRPARRGRGVRCDGGAVMFEDDIPDDDTPDGFDPDKVIERWEELEELGYAIIPEDSEDNE